MIHFGTGGWRAIIADEFTRANIQLLAQALSEKMLSEDAHEIVIGFDRRFLSDVGAQWACEVFAANGITPYYIPKNAPTPLIMLAVKEIGCKDGMAAVSYTHLYRSIRRPGRSRLSFFFQPVRAFPFK